VQKTPANAEPNEARLGFAVIYRWRVDPSKEDQFRKAWEEITRAIRDFDGGLGSRLHKASDGTWLAYAQWPDRERWEQAGAGTESTREAMQLFRDAIEERLPHIELEPVADYLVQSRVALSSLNTPNGAARTNAQSDMPKIIDFSNKGRGKEDSGRSFDELLADLRPHTIPALTPRKVGTPTRSYFGGDPYLPREVRWPTQKEAHLDFLASIDLQEIADTGVISWLPSTGRLLFFYDAEHQPWGSTRRIAGAGRCCMSTRLA